MEYTRALPLATKIIYEAVMGALCRQSIMYLNVRSQHIISDKSVINEEPA